MVYIDESGYTVTLTVAQQSIFVSTAPTTADPHIPVIDMSFQGGGSSSIPDPSAYCCEQVYGVYMDSPTSKYVLNVVPYADPLNIGANKYPFNLSYVDTTEGIHQKLVSGTLSVTSDAEDNIAGDPKPTPRLDSGEISFTYRGNTFTGSIYSDLESSGGC